MKKLINTLVLIILLVFTLKAQQNIISAYGGALVPTGDNTENYDIGYNIGLGYEFRPIKNFGFNVSAGYSYIYCEMEDYMPYFGMWVDNDMPFFDITPKFILSKDKLNFYIGSSCRATVILTNVSMYALGVYGNGNYNPREWDESDETFMLSLNAAFGAEYFITKNVGFGIDFDYHLVNLNNGTTTIELDKYEMDNNEVDIKGLGINIKAMVRF